MKRDENVKSRSVVYSFEGRWEEPIRHGKVRVFFRKRRPVKSPKRIFLYLGVPVKKIIGFADVQKIEPVRLDEAISARARGAITENELIKYIGENGTVHAIYIEKPTMFSQPFELSELNDQFGFSPPQSFSNVDEDFEKQLLGRTKK